MTTTAATADRTKQIAAFMDQQVSVDLPHDYLDWDWYAGSVIWDPMTGRLACVIDWDTPSRFEPAPKPPGGKREPRPAREGKPPTNIVDKDPMETARREAEEEIDFSLRPDQKGILVSFEERTNPEDHYAFLYLWVLSTQEFDEQEQRAKREQHARRTRKLLQVMTVDQVIDAIPDKGYVRRYQDALKPALRVMQQVTERLNRQAA